MLSSGPAAAAAAAAVSCSLCRNAVCCAEAVSAAAPTVRLLRDHYSSMNIRSGARDAGRAVSYDVACIDDGEDINDNGRVNVNSKHRRSSSLLGQPPTPPIEIAAMLPQPNCRQGVWKRRGLLAIRRLYTVLILFILPSATIVLMARDVTHPPYCNGGDGGHGAGQGRHQQQGVERQPTFDEGAETRLGTTARLLDDVDGDNAVGRRFEWSPNVSLSDGAIVRVRILMPLPPAVIRSVELFRLDPAVSNQTEHRLHAIVGGGTLCRTVNTLTRCLADLRGGCFERTAADGAPTHRSSSAPLGRDESRLLTVFLEQLADCSAHVTGAAPVQTFEHLTTQIQKRGKRSSGARDGQKNQKEQQDYKLAYTGSANDIESETKNVG